MAVEHDIEIVVATASGELVQDPQLLSSQAVAPQGCDVLAHGRAANEARILVEFIQRHVQEPE